MLVSTLNSDLLTIVYYAFIHIYSTYNILYIYIFYTLLDMSIGLHEILENWIVLYSLIYHQTNFEDISELPTANFFNTSLFFTETTADAVTRLIWCDAQKN